MSVFGLKLKVHLCIEPFLFECSTVSIPTVLSDFYWSWLLFKVEPRSASIAAPTQHPPIRESSIEFLSSVDLPETKVLQETDKKVTYPSYSHNVFI